MPKCTTTYNQQNHHDSSRQIYADVIIAYIFAH